MGSLICSTSCCNVLWRRTSIDSCTHFRKTLLHTAGWAYLLRLVGQQPLLQHILIHAVCCTPNCHLWVCTAAVTGCDAHAVDSSEVLTGHQHIPEVIPSIKHIVTTCDTNVDGASILSGYAVQSA